MGEFPNKATQFKTGISAVTAGRKGGEVRSLKKKYSAKIRALKEQGLKDKHIEWILQTMLKPEASTFDIRGDIEALKDQMNINDYIRLKQVNHKLHHGEFLKTENVHHIVNWNNLLNPNEKNQTSNDDQTED
jgi:hypothetical protein